MLSIMPFWLVMMLLCCAMVSFRLLISRLNSSRLLVLPAHSGEIDRAVGNGGNSFCVPCGAVRAAIWFTVVCCSSCADRSVLFRVLSDCWASSTFALGFLARPLGAGGTRGGVVEPRSGVDVAGAMFGGPQGPPCSGN